MPRPRLEDYITAIKSAGEQNYAHLFIYLAAVSLSHLPTTRSAHATYTSGHTELYESAQQRMFIKTLWK